MPARLSAAPKPCERANTAHWRQPNIASLWTMGTGVPANSTDAWSALPGARPSIDTLVLPESVIFG